MPIPEVPRIFAYFFSIIHIHVYIGLVPIPEGFFVGARAKGRKNILTTFQEAQKTVFHLYLVLHIKGFLYNTVHFNIVC